MDQEITCEYLRNLRTLFRMQMNRTGENGENRGGKQVLSVPSVTSCSKQIRIEFGIGSSPLRLGDFA
jgi:hypothetical protein